MAWCQVRQVMSIRAHSRLPISVRSPSGRCMSRKAPLKAQVVVDLQCRDELALLLHHALPGQALRVVATGPTLTWPPLTL